MLIETLIILLILLPGGIPIYCIGTFIHGFLNAKDPPPQYNRLQTYSFYRVGVKLYRWIHRCKFKKEIINDHNVSYKEILNREKNIQQKEDEIHLVTCLVRYHVENTYNIKAIRNDKIIEGRSLKWNGEHVGNKLLSSSDFKSLINSQKQLGYNISLRILRATKTRKASTRIYIERN